MLYINNIKVEFECQGFNGRTLKDFAMFFEEINPDTLSAVIAVAMDMNASYHKLVEERMPNAEIVYDRYHMQAQYGKEVL